MPASMYHNVGGGTIHCNERSRGKIINFRKAHSCILRNHGKSVSIGYVNN